MNCKSDFSYEYLFLPLQNKAKALKVLRARLYEMERSRLQKSRSKLRSEQVSSSMLFFLHLLLRPTTGYANDLNRLEAVTGLSGSGHTISLRVESLITASGSLITLWRMFWKGIA